MRYGISYGNGNDGVSRLYPAFTVEAPEGSEYLIARLAALSYGFGVSRRWLKEAIEIDEAGDNAATLTVLNPPRSPEWSEHNGAWKVVEVFPADDYQSDNSHVIEYASLDECFGRQLVRACRAVEPVETAPVMVPQPVQQQQACAAIDVAPSPAVDPGFPAFGSFVYHDQFVELERDGFTLRATIVNDDDAGPPWENECALWGIEANYPDSDNSYLTEVANDHIDEALELARAAIERLTTERAL